MLQARDARLNEKFPARKRSHFFDHSFIKQLLNVSGYYNFCNVEKTSDKVDVFNCSKLFFPINIDESHWTLCVIFMDKKCIIYYNSKAQGDSGTELEYCQSIRKWLYDCSNRFGRIVHTDILQWPCSVGECPQQNDGYNCGL